MARAQSCSGSRSPFLANWKIILATVVVAGSSRSLSPSLATQATNALTNAAASSGENESSSFRTSPIGMPPLKLFDPGSPERTLGADRARRRIRARDHEPHCPHQSLSKQARALAPRNGSTEHEARFRQVAQSAVSVRVRQAFFKVPALARQFAPLPCKLCKVRAHLVATGHCGHVLAVPSALKIVL